MKTTFLSLAILLTAKFAASAVTDLGAPTEHTPYDRFLTPVKESFSSMHGDGASMDKVQALMRQGRSFRYAHTESPLTDAEKHEAQRLLGVAIDHLPDDQRTTLILVEYHHMQYQEISEILGVTVSAIKMRIKRARETLRENLKMLQVDR